MAKVVDLLPWDISVKTAVEKRSASAILEREDADQVIAELSELEAYYAVKSLGVDDATPFLAVLRPEQIRTLVDLDTWHHSQLDLGDLMLWLNAFREAGVERLVAAAHAIDPEVMALLFRRRLLIARKVRDDNGDLSPDWAVNPADEILPLVETPDGRFIVAARPIDENDWHDESEVEDLDEEDRKSVLELVRDLYKHDDMEHIAGLIRLAETDLTSDVEETALRFRDARMEDLGFPSRERAMAVYAVGDADALADTPVPALAPPESDPDGVRMPAVHAQHAAEGLFHAAMRAIEDPGVVRRIEGELVAMANHVLVADNIEPGALDRIGEVLLRVRSTLELALLHRAPAGAALEQARDRLIRWPLRTLFAAGYGLTVRLASRARALAKDQALAAGGQPLGLLDDADRTVLAGLTRGRRPTYARAGAEPRGFARPEELAEVGTLLDELAVWADVARHLELAQGSAALGAEVEPPEVGERTLGLLVGTLAAHVLLGDAPSLKPIGVEALGRLGRVLAGEGAPPEHGAAVGDRAGAGLPDPTGTGAAGPVAAAAARAAMVIARTAGRDPEDAAVRARVERALTEVAESLVPLVRVGTAIDPRFVGGLVRARS